MTGPFRLPSINGRNVAVLGAGLLGRGIACGWAASGYNIIIRDPDPLQRKEAVQYCMSNMSRYSNSPTQGSIQATGDLHEAVHQCWLSVEAVPEDLSLKSKIFSGLEKLSPKDSILCSNSSSYRSRDIVKGLRAETRRRSLNMHYYTPPDCRVVELMTCGETDKSIFPFMVQKLKETNFKPYIARYESTGLIYNRVWAAIKREVLTLLAEGISTPQEIDDIWKEVWYSQQKGPVAMMDAAGLDTILSIEKHYVKEFSLSSVPVKYLQQFVDQGKLGIKSDKGGILS